MCFFAGHDCCAGRHLPPVSAAAGSVDNGDIPEQAKILAFHRSASQRTSPESKGKKYESEKG